MTPDWHEPHGAGFFDNLVPVTKRIPVWFQGDRDHQTIGATLPWLGLDTADCEHLNQFCYLVRTSHTRNNLPPLSALSTFCAAWDEDLSEVTQYHLVMFDWGAYQDVYRTIADDAVNMIDDGDIAEIHRLQTFITIHFFEPSDVVETIGSLHRSLLQLREDHEELRRRFERYREYTSRVMEWIASHVLPWPARWISSYGRRIFSQNNSNRWEYLHPT